MNSMKDVGVIAGFVIFNLFCGWILFGGGADRLEGTSFSWLTGARFGGNSTGWTAEGIKVAVGVVVFFEIVIGVVLFAYQ